MTSLKILLTPRRPLALAAALLLGSCASVPEPQAAAAAPATKSQLPPPRPAPAAIPQPDSTEIGQLPPAIAEPLSAARTSAQYQRQIAEHLHAANGGRVYEGRPPNPLRAVIVYQTEIDVTGHPAAIRQLRSPGSPQLEARVVESLRRAAPFPAPPVALLRDTGRVTLVETWLFDYQGKFRLRTLSLPQDPNAGVEPPKAGKL